MRRQKTRIGLKLIKVYFFFTKKTPHVKTKLKNCKQVIQQKAFARAIAGEEKKDEPLPDFKDMTIDQSYSGPVIPDDGT